MASLNTILSDIGNGLKKFFGVAVTAARAAEPIVDIVFPGVAALYNATAEEAAKVEAAAIAAGQQSGTGPQKLALVVQAIEGEFAQFANTYGIAADVQAIEAYVNAVVASLNALKLKAKS
jgi:hypothetical protein